MTNKHASKQHGLVGNTRPVKAFSKRKNKAGNRLRQQARQAALRQALSPISLP